MDFIKNYKIVLFYFFVFIGCTKTKIGDYKMIIDGTITTSSSNHDFNSNVTTSTITTLPYYLEKDIVISQVGNSSIQIDGQIWIKDGRSLSYKDSSTYQTPGSSSSNKKNYNGQLISISFIEGDYFYSDNFGSNGHVSSSKITAIFTINKK